MDIYDRCYQQLKQTGQLAWAGEGYDRAWRKLTATLQSLKDGRVLPAAGSVCLELGCGNGAMAVTELIGFLQRLGVADSGISKRHLGAPMVSVVSVPFVNSSSNCQR